MDTDEIEKQLSFLKAERDLPERFGISPDAFLPLFFSLRFGGDYSYAAEEIRTISIVKKTSVYDDETGIGYSREEIFLFVNPHLVESEGAVHRLEKCGNEQTRMLVKRPFRVRVRAGQIIKMTVNPLHREIVTGRLLGMEMTLSGSTAYDLAHEMEHLQEGKVSGEKPPGVSDPITGLPREQDDEGCSVSGCGERQQFPELPGEKVSGAIEPCGYDPSNPQHQQHTCRVLPRTRLIVVHIQCFEVVVDTVGIRNIHHHSAVLKNVADLKVHSSRILALFRLST